MEKRKCVMCGEEYIPKMWKQETCGNKKCSYKNNYIKNRDTYIKRTRIWEKNNPERSKKKS